FVDYAEDTEAQRFNALAAAFSEKAWRSQAINIFHRACGELRKTFPSLLLSRPALLQTLLLQKLQQKGKRSLRICPGMINSYRFPSLQDGGVLPEKASEQWAKKKKKKAKKYRSEGPWCCDCCPCDCLPECACCDCDCCNGCDCDCCGGCDCGC
ncbi:MAG: hypothetical protein D3910_28295, partial [Candidatus Electrothrix sp. ATG2]|nr:hypothetical protein [Candidatus Electrothrix sp. ATG2]